MVERLKLYEAGKTPTVAASAASSSTSVGITSSSATAQPVGGNTYNSRRRHGVSPSTELRPTSGTFALASNSSGSSACRPPSRPALPLQEEPPSLSGHHRHFPPTATGAFSGRVKPPGYDASMRRYHGSPMGFYPGPPPQSFQDDAYGVGSMRQLEEGFVNRGFNPYGLSHRIASMTDSCGLVAVARQLTPVIWADG